MLPDLRNILQNLLGGVQTSDRVSVETQSPATTHFGALLSELHQPSDNAEQGLPVVDTVTSNNSGEREISDGGDDPEYPDGAERSGPKPPDSGTHPALQPDEPPTAQTLAPIAVESAVADAAPKKDPGVEPLIQSADTSSAARENQSSRPAGTETPRDISSDISSDVSKEVSNEVDRTRTAATKARPESGLTIRYSRSRLHQTVTLQSAQLATARSTEPEADNSQIRQPQQNLTANNELGGSKPEPRVQMTHSGRVPLAASPPMPELDALRPNPETVEVRAQQTVTRENPTRWPLVQDLDVEPLPGPAKPMAKAERQSATRSNVEASAPDRATTMVNRHPEPTAESSSRTQRIPSASSYAASQRMTSRAAVDHLPSDASTKTVVHPTVEPREQELVRPVQANRTAPAGRGEILGGATSGESVSSTDARQSSPRPNGDSNRPTAPVGNVNQYSRAQPKPNVASLLGADASVVGSRNDTGTNVNAPQVAESSTTTENSILPSRQAERRGHQLETANAFGTEDPGHDRSASVRLEQRPSTKTTVKPAGSTVLTSEAPSEAPPEPVVRASAVRSADPPDIRMSQRLDFEPRQGPQRRPISVIAAREATTPIPAKSGSETNTQDDSATPHYVAPNSSRPVSESETLINALRMGSSAERAIHDAATRRPVATLFAGLHQKHADTHEVPSLVRNDTSGPTRQTLGADVLPSGKRLEQSGTQPRHTATVSHTTPIVHSTAPQTNKPVVDATSLSLASTHEWTRLRNAALTTKAQHLVDITEAEIGHRPDPANEVDQPSPKLSAPSPRSEPHVEARGPQAKANGPDAHDAVPLAKEQVETPTPLRAGHGEPAEPSATDATEVPVAQQNTPTPRATIRTADVATSETNAAPAQPTGGHGGDNAASDDRPHRGSSNERQPPEKLATSAAAPATNQTGTSAAILQESVEPTFGLIADGLTRMESATDLTAPAGTPRRTGGQSTWFQPSSQMRSPGAVITAEDGWRSIEMSLDDGDSKIRISTRRDLEVTRVALEFTDPAVRTQIEQNADRLKTILTEKYDSHVELDLGSDSYDRQQGDNRSREPIRRPSHSELRRSQEHNEAVTITSTLRHRATGAANEWIG